MKYAWQTVPDGAKYTDGCYEGEIIDSTEWGDIQVIDGVNRLVLKPQKRLFGRRKFRGEISQLKGCVRDSAADYERTMLCIVAVVIFLFIYA